MNYSTTPLQYITGSGDHTGFAFVCAGSVIFLAVLYAIYKDSPRMVGEATAWAIVTLLFVALAYLISFDEPPVRKITNRQVTGTYVGMLAEGCRYQSCKNQVDKHALYVMYEVDGKVVTFLAGEGVAYPKKAILYENP